MVREMKRTQIQLDESTYRLARQRAFDEGVSMASVVREALRQYLVPEGDEVPTIEALGFVGVGRSEQGSLSPVSERHDEALGDAFAR